MIAIIFKIWVVGFFIFVFITNKQLTSLSEEVVKTHNNVFNENFIRILFFLTYTIEIFFIWPFILFKGLVRIYKFWIIKRKLKKVLNSIDAKDIEEIVKKLNEVLNE